MNKTLGQIHDEIYKSVSDLHTAFMGDDRDEINQAQKKYDEMISVHGKGAVQLLVDYYNENVIRKAK
jgi:uncharacterized protein YbcI